MWLPPRMLPLPTGRNTSVATPFGDSDDINKVNYESGEHVNNC